AIRLSRFFMGPPILLGRKNAVMSTAFFGSTTTVSIAHPTSKKANSPGPRQTSAGALGYKGRSDPSHRTRRMGHPQNQKQIPRQVNSTPARYDDIACSRCRPE